MRKSICDIRSGFELWSFFTLRCWLEELCETASRTGGCAQVLRGRLIRKLGWRCGRHAGEKFLEGQRRASSRGLLFRCILLRQAVSKLPGEIAGRRMLSHR
jgi:hypothetical protein